MLVVDVLVVDELVVGIGVWVDGAASGRLVAGASWTGLPVPVGPFAVSTPSESDEGCIATLDSRSSSMVPATVVAQPVASTARTAATAGCRRRSGTDMVLVVRGSGHARSSDICDVGGSLPNSYRA